MVKMDIAETMELARWSLASCQRLLHDRTHAMDEARKSLNDFFLKHFNSGAELGLFLRDTFNTQERSHGDELVDAVAWQRSRSVVFHEVARALVRRGMVVVQLFAALREQFPWLDEEVTTLQRAFGVEPAQSQQPAAKASVHWVDQPSFAWSEPVARELFELLVQAYDNANAVDQLVAFVGIDKSTVDLSGPLRTRWYNLINAAAAARKLRALCDEVLADPSRGAYHTTLRNWLARPAA